MDVFVTGGSGTIGTFVTESLRDRGHDVTVFDRDAPTVEGVEYIPGDVTDRTAVASAVKDRDAIVHMAALLPPACEADPRRAERVNVGGTLNVLAESPDSAKIVCVSSKAVFGPFTGVYGHPTYEALGEDAPKAPVNVYGTTKLACEGYCRAYARRGKSIAIVRFASTYGPGKGAAYGELAYLAQTIARAREADTISLDGGDQLDDLVYFGDIGRGIADAVEATAWTYRAYHLGTGNMVSPHDLADCLEAELPVSVTVNDGLNYRNMPYPTYCRFDISRAKADLGYEPAFSLRDGIKDFLRRMDR